MKQQIELYYPINKPQHTTLHRKEYARLKRAESEMANLKAKAAITIYSLTILAIGILSGIGFGLFAFMN